MNVSLKNYYEKNYVSLKLTLNPFFAGMADSLPGDGKNEKWSGQLFIFWKKFQKEENE